jgi:hypothetical protein
MPGTVALDVLGLDVVDLHIRQGLQAGVGQGLVEGLVGVRQLHVLAHHGHAHGGLALGELALQHLVPLGEICRGAVEVEALDDKIIQPLAVQRAGNTVDGIRIEQRDDRTLLDVGEQGDLAAALSSIARTSGTAARPAADRWSAVPSPSAAWAWS